MPQNFPADGVFSWILDDALRLAFLIFLDRDDSFWEAFDELLLMFGWNGTAEDNVWKQAVRCGRCALA